MVQALWAPDSEFLGRCFLIRNCHLCPGGLPSLAGLPLGKRPLLPVPNLAGATWAEDRRSLHVTLSF